MALSDSTRKYYADLIRNNPDRDPEVLTEGIKHYHSDGNNTKLLPLIDQLESAGRRRMQAAQTSSDATGNGEQGERGDFMQGLNRGIQQTQGMLHGGAALGGKLMQNVGMEETGGAIKDWGIEGYKRNMAEAAQFPAKHSFKDVYTGEAGFGGAIDWAQGVLGELAPTMAEAAIGTLVGTLAAPGAGSAAGAFASRSILKKSIDKMTKEAIEQGLGELTEAEIRKQITKQVLKSAGGKVGMGAAVLPMEAGGMYADLLESHGVDAPGTALLFGAAATSFEYMGGNSRLIDNLVNALALGKGGIVKRTAKEILKGIPEEATQEGAQELMGVLNTVVNTDEKLLTGENLEQIVEAMAAGAVGGGAGAVFNGLTSKREEDTSKKKKTDEDKPKKPGSKAEEVMLDPDDVGKSPEDLIMGDDDFILQDDDVQAASGFTDEELDAAERGENIDPAEAPAQPEAAPTEPVEPTPEEAPAQEPEPTVAENATVPEAAPDEAVKPGHVDSTPYSDFAPTQEEEAAPDAENPMPGGLGDSIPESPKTPEAPKPSEEPTTPAQPEIEIGQTVTWTNTKGEPLTGTVVKANGEKAMVETDGGKTYRPSKDILTVSEPAPESTSEAPEINPQVNKGVIGEIPYQSEDDPAQFKNVPKSGSQLGTTSGNQTTPFPKTDYSTPQKATNSRRRIQKWLIENAIAEAESRKDDLNVTVFGANLKHKDIPTATLEDAENYLFGEQPPVKKLILKPLIPKTTKKGVEEGTQKLPVKKPRFPKIGPKAEGHKWRKWMDSVTKSFTDPVMQQFGFSASDADKIWDGFLAQGLLSINQKTGQVVLTDKGAWDKDVMQRALQQEKENIASQARKHDYTAMKWKDLVERAKDAGMYKVGMSRVQIEAALKGEPIPPSKTREDKDREWQEAKAEARKKRREEEQETADAFEKAVSSSWVKKHFPHEDKNPYNLLALTRFLEGHSPKFYGAIDRGWEEPIRNFGAVKKDGNTIDWKALKKAYEADSNNDGNNDAGGSIPGETVNKPEIRSQDKPKRWDQAFIDEFETLPSSNWIKDKFRSALLEGNAPLALAKYIEGEADDVYASLPSSWIPILQDFGVIKKRDDIFEPKKVKWEKLRESYAATKDRTSAEQVPDKTTGQEPEPTVAENATVPEAPKPSEEPTTPAQPEIEIGQTVTWTNTKGESLTGTVVKANGEKAMVETDGGKTYRPSKDILTVSEPATDKFSLSVEEPKAFKRGIQGKKETAYLNDNTPVDIQYEVMDLDDLIASHDSMMKPNPAYPQEFQPRARERKTSQLQVEAIANKLNPERLGQNAGVAEGAPIISMTGNHVESGNGRTIAIRMAYARETGKKYKEWLNGKAADFGIDSKAMEGIERPVLVRRRLTDMDVADFVKRANESNTARLSATEQAAIDADRITPHDISIFEPNADGDITGRTNKAFIDRFLSNLSQEEQAGFLTEDGRPSKQLVDRIQAAVFHKAYGSEDLLKLAAEEANPDIKNILNGLNFAAATFAMARGLREDFGGLSVVSDLVSGIKIIQEAKGGGDTGKVADLVENHLAQGNLFGDTNSDESKTIARTIAENIRSGKRIGEFLKAMGHRLKAFLSDLDQIEIGGKQDLTTGDLVKGAVDKLEEIYGQGEETLFDFKPEADPGTGQTSNTGDNRGRVPGREPSGSGRTEAEGSEGQVDVDGKSLSDLTEEEAIQFGLSVGQKKKAMNKIANRLRSQTGEYKDAPEYLGAKADFEKTRDAAIRIFGIKADHHNGGRGLDQQQKAERLTEGQILRIYRKKSQSKSATDLLDSEVVPKGKPERQADKKASSGKHESGADTHSETSDTDSGYGSKNKIFTEDAAAKARELLRKKLNNLNTGLDPEMIQAGITLAGYHIEAGARTFADYTKAMVADLGDAVKPFLRSWYEGVRYYPGMDATGMSSAAEIDALDIDAIGKDSKAEKADSKPEETQEEPKPPSDDWDGNAAAKALEGFIEDRKTVQDKLDEQGRVTDARLEQKLRTYNKLIKECLEEMDKPTKLEPPSDIDLTPNKGHRPIPGIPGYTLYIKQADPKSNAFVSIKTKGYDTPNSLRWDTTSTIKASVEEAYAYVMDEFIAKKAMGKEAWERGGSKDNAEESPKKPTIDLSPFGENDPPTREYGAYRYRFVEIDDGSFVFRIYDPRRSDLGVRVEGKTLAEAHAAAMKEFEIYRKDPDGYQQEQSRRKRLNVGRREVSRISPELSDAMFGDDGPFAKGKRADRSGVFGVLGTLYSKKHKFKAGAEKNLRLIEAAEDVLKLFPPVDEYQSLAEIDKMEEDGHFNEKEADAARTIVNSLQKTGTFAISRNPERNTFMMARNLVEIREPASFAHEVGHWGFFNVLTAKDRIKYIQSCIDRFYGGTESMNDLLAVKNFQGREVDTGLSVVRSNHADNFAEYFAEQFRQYVHTNVLTDTQHRGLFDRLVGFMKEVFLGVRDKDLLDKKLQPFFRKIISKSKATEYRKQRKEKSGQIPGQNEAGDAVTTNEDKGKPPEKSGQIPGQKAPHETIADYVVKAFKEGRQIKFPDLVKIANEAYGDTQANGAYTPKDVYDATELGVNRYLMEIQSIADPTVKTSAEAKTLVVVLRHLLQSIPTQTKRTEEMDEFQQFSTPPHIAFAAAWAANMNAADTVLEPSAGIGGLALFGKNAKANVVVNELSKRRAEILKGMRFDRVFTENAEHINNILPKEVKPTVVLMNPPFSATAGRIKGQRKTVNAQAHIEQALARLQEGGRLVAIVGRGMALGRPTMAKWWDKMMAKYNVRANVGLSGKEYTKYGTSFDIRYLVIDKDGTTTTPPVSETFDTVEEVLEAFEEIRNERPTRDFEGYSEGASTPAESTLPEGDEGNQGDSDTQADGRDSGTPDVGDGEQQADISAEVPGDSDRENPRGGSDESGGRDNPSRGKTSKGGGERNAPSGEKGNTSGAGRKDSGGKDSGRSDKPRKVKQKAKKEEKKKELTDSVYETYEPQITVEGAKPHPGKLSESAAMAAVGLPKTDYIPNLPASAIESGKISSAQLEPVILAGAAHSQKLTSGERKGFFIGDGTGVGKGREIASIMWDNWNQGRKKHVWISKNPGLMKDAQRDVEGVGWDKSLVSALSKVKANQPIKMEEGVLFSSYGTLKSASKDGRSRLDQIIEWLGEDFDGVIAFDEAHMMGNAIDVKGTRGTKKASQTGLAGLEIQNRLPNARIVYVSATGATEVTNLSYAKRLGLWGQGTPFGTVDKFINKIASGGVAAMELVASDMKALGSYLARGLSYDGVSYNRLEHTLTGSQQRDYNKFSEAWQTVLRNIHDALAETGASKGARNAAMSAFWGAQQRFYNQVLTSMQIPSMLKDADRRLAEGQSVVIQLTNTNESDLKKAISEMGDEDTLEDLDFTPRRALMGFVENSFPVKQFVETQDEEGNIVMVPLLDSEGNPVLNAEAVARRERLLDEIGSIQMVDAPIDMIMNHFGKNNVAEVTGRTRRAVWAEDSDGNMSKVLEKRTNRTAASEADEFMAMKRRVLIFSEAGGTGFSFHADLSKKNQQPRAHYLLQAGWRADVAVQGLGRSHRSNQAQTPEFILMTTNVPAQKRFISTISRRLDQLGALTKGQRQTGSQGFFQAKDNLESDIAVRAMTNTVMDLLGGRIVGISGDQFSEQTGLTFMAKDGSGKREVPPIPQIMNRLLSLNLDTMNRFFEEFEGRLDDLIGMAVEDGTLDVGMETLQADSIKLKDERTVFTEQKSGATTQYANLALEKPYRIIDFLTIKNAAVRKEGVPHFVQNKTSGKIWAVTSTPIGRTTSEGAIVYYQRMEGVTGSLKREKPQYINDMNRYQELSPRDAERIWEEQVKATPPTYTEEVHLITGTMLPIWDRLPESHPRIIRVQTDEGRVFLGRQISGGSIRNTLRNLGADVGARTYSKESAIGNLFDGGSVELANGWKIKRSIVSGERRFEVTGPGLDDYAEMDRLGIFRERISSKTRNFIPVNRMKQIAGELIDLHGIRRMTTSGGTQFSDSSDGRMPGQGLSLDEIRSRFPGQHVGKGNDGHIWVRMKNGMGLKIKNVTRMDEGDVQLAIKTGRMSRGGLVLGKYFDHTITLNSDYATAFTRDHELEHFLEDVGLITDFDQRVLDNKFTAMRKAGELKFRVSTDQRENRANLLAQIMGEREGMRKSTLGKLLQKIADFLDALFHVGRASTGKLARSIESGKIYSKQGSDASGDSIGMRNPDDPRIQFSTASAKEGTESWAFEMYENFEIPDGWYVHGKREGENLERWGSIQLSQDWGVAEQYSGSDVKGYQKTDGSMWMIRPSKDANILDLSSSVTTDMDKLVERALQDFKDGNLPFEEDIAAVLSEDEELDESAVEDAVRSEFAPDDIVTSAQAFDNELYNQWLEKNFDVDFVYTPDGGLAFDIDKCDSVMVPKWEESQFSTSDDQINPRRKKKEGYAGEHVAQHMPEGVAKTMQKDRGIKPSRLKEKLESWITDMKAEIEHHPHLTRMPDGPAKSATEEILRRHQEVKSLAQDRAGRRMSKIIGGLTSEEYDLFSMELILGDEVRAIEDGMRVDGKLPFGFKTTDEIIESHKKIQAANRKNSKIKKALKERRKWQKEMAKDLVRLGIMKKEILREGDYFHHQVLKYWNNEADNHYKGMATSTTSEVRNKWRPWMAARKGSPLDYNTEYLEAELVTAAQQLAQIETAKNMRELQKLNDVLKKLKRQAKDFNNDYYAAIVEDLKEQDMNYEDPMIPHKAKIARGFQELQEMAVIAKSADPEGGLTYDSEFEDVVSRLAGLTDPETLEKEPFDPRIFPFLSHLLERNHEGALQAAMIFKGIKGRNRLLKETLGEAFKTWENLVPPGYTTWKPDPKDKMFWTNSITDQVFQDVLTGVKELQDKDVRRVLAKGTSPVWVIPEGLAKTMEEFRTHHNEGRIAASSAWALSSWKKYILLNPLSWFKYNVNNTTGDADAVFAYEPEIMKPGAVKKAATELYDWMKFRLNDESAKSERLEAELDDALRSGVINSGFVVQEVADTLDEISMEEFAQDLIGEGPSNIFHRMGRKYWKWAKDTSQLRENVLRLCAYRWALKRFEAGDYHHYGACKNPESIDHLNAQGKHKEAAAKLARELLGDYGNISHHGEWIRNHLIPFWSWMEINAPRYVYMMRNLKQEGGNANRAGRMGWVMAKRGSVFAVKASALASMVMIWNMTMFPDELDDLGEEKRQQLHLIIGRRADGSVMSIRFQAALADALSWFGKEDLPEDIADLVKGRSTIQEQLLDVPKSTYNKLVNGVRPDVKVPFETMMGKSTFPDATAPRHIRDKVEHVLKTFKLDMPYRHLTGRPGRGSNVASHLLNDIMAIAVHSTEPGMQAYYDTRHTVFEWNKKQGNDSKGWAPNKKSNSLYYYKQALKYGDLKAAERYLKKYYELGGTPKGMVQSIRLSHPLAGVDKKDRYRFKMSLDAGEKRRLEKAIMWHRKTYMGGK